MSGVNGIGGYSAYNPYQNISSGSRLNKAANGASELAINEKMETQNRGYQVGEENLQAGKSALNISDGAMDGISDYLHRMRELALKAKNDLLDKDDKTAIQQEIDQLKSGINDAVSQAKYNEKPMLDEDGQVTLLSDANGTTMDISTGAMNSDALGINDFNVLENFDLDSIDKALERVSTSRSRVGAETNMLDYASAYNATAAENITASQSTLGDANIAEEVLNVKKEETLDAVQIMMQKRQEEDEQAKSAQLFAQ